VELLQLLAELPGPGTFGDDGDAAAGMRGDVDRLRDVEAALLGVT
jgi:hypothetical protein